MVKKIIFFILIFYILALLQTSFLVHFNIKGYVLNLILMAVILINLFERTKNYSGILAGIIGGLYLDIFSLSNRGGFFGFYTLILLGFSLFLKIIFKKYVRFPVAKRI